MQSVSALLLESIAIEEDVATKPLKKGCCTGFCKCDIVSYDKAMFSHFFCKSSEQTLLNRMAKTLGSSSSRKAKISYRNNQLSCVLHNLISKSFSQGSLLLFWILQTSEIVLQ